MKTATITLLLNLLLSASYAQSSGDTTYIDDDDNTVSKEQAKLIRVISHEGYIYKFCDYYLTGIKQMDGYCMFPNGGVKTRRFVYYDEKGKKTEEGVYTNDKRDGLWTHYREDTTVEIIWYTETYVNGMLKGEIIGYYPSGAKKTVEDYNAEKSVGKTYDDLGVEISYQPFKVMPKYNGDLLNYLGKNMRYPPDCIDANIQGRVDIRFVVADNGIIQDVHVARKAHPLLDAEALRLWKSMPKWVPGTLDGKKAKFHMTQPLTFKLD
jgi:TonB family protein